MNFPRANSLASRVAFSLTLAFVLLLAATVFIQARLQLNFARETARHHGLSLAEALHGALSSHMMANDRERLQHSMRELARHASDLRVRIFNKEGKIVFSSTQSEIGTQLDPRSEACFKCHAKDRPIEKLPPGERTRLFDLDGHPALGVIRPIENDPSCSSAACHAHPPEKRLLGVLDVTWSLAPVEKAQRQAVWLMGASSVLVLLVLIGIMILLLRRLVHRPIGNLTQTLDALAQGDYSARCLVKGQAAEEFLHLGDALNHSAQELERANLKLLEWAQTLEHRVEEKTAELRMAQEQMVQVARIASLGKLAAVVAHEINNPMASVVTYARLLHKRMSRKPQLDEAEREQLQILEAIASESSRCGEIVSSLLLFARRTDAVMEPIDLRTVVHKAVFLIKHKMDLAGVSLTLELPEEALSVVNDAGQLEQALLALCINAIESMAEGGVLTIGGRVAADGEIHLWVRDTGVGIPDEVKGNIFEPFFTTKGEGSQKGLGLGLSVVYGIMQRSGGRIEVESRIDAGSAFTLVLPREGAQPGPDKE